MAAGDDLRAAARRLAAMPAKLAKAQKRALQKASKQTKTAVSAAVRAQIPLKKAYVDQRIKATIGTVGDGTETAIISTPKRGLLLTRFPWKELKVKGKKAGIGVKVKTGGGYEKLTHAFPIRLRAGGSAGENVGIAVRKGPDYSRYPVDVLHGKSISQAFAGKLPVLKGEAADLYRKVMQQELNYALRVRS